MIPVVSVRPRGSPERGTCMVCDQMLWNERDFESGRCAAHHRWHACEVCGRFQMRARRCAEHRDWMWCRHGAGHWAAPRDADRAESLCRHHEWRVDEIAHTLARMHVAP